MVPEERWEKTCQVTRPLGLHLSFYANRTHTLCPPTHEYHAVTCCVVSIVQGAQRVLIAVENGAVRAHVEG